MCFIVFSWSLKLRFVLFIEYNSFLGFCWSVVFAGFESLQPHKSLCKSSVYVFGGLNWGLSFGVVPFFGD